MSRSDASPDADTVSYWPVFIRATISSDVPAILVLTLQPVCFSNGVTQSTLGSLEPSSAYPAQATRLTWPSPCPTDCCIGTLGTVKPPCPAAVALSPESPPQAAAVSPIASVAAAASAMRVDHMGNSLFFGGFGGSCGVGSGSGRRCGAGARDMELVCFVPADP